METDTVLHQQLPSAYRTLQPQATQAIQHGQTHLNHPALASQHGLNLNGIDDSDNVFHELHRLQENNHNYHAPNAFDHTQAHRLHVPDTDSPHTPQQHTGQFGVLTSGGSLQHNAINRLQRENDIFGGGDDGDQKSNGHQSSKIVVDPPNLAEWRQRLFNVDDTITLSEEEFETYFAHVDNVYSHRSTQRYKRKPFVSHYWDCRLKGRPPGTPKSDDPNKKKRKRTARERDLCDVKIKITEFFPGAMLRADFTPERAESYVQRSDGLPGPSQTNGYYDQGNPIQDAQHNFGLMMSNTVPQGHPGASGQRYYTIQRVNGNGGNGKGDGVAGPHKHTLEESDRVKKNSVQRFLLKKDKEEKKTQKTHHKKANGAALLTVRKHSKDNELKLFGRCFCPFVQRIWIALEAKGLQYQYIEVDPYKKPQALIEVDSKGLIPALRHGDWACSETNVLMEYLEDLGIGDPLLPTGNPQLRARCRLWCDHVSRISPNTSSTGSF
ncbi:glutathione transferase [Phlyctema vagabunda]|uniref:Glutathione transferase n=1 Tax=Phlyctema vagabunda TaxID=108571 RepID=A0ABR4PXB3_9HELO